VEARAARWRDQVAGRKILLLLDDAAGHDQVRPLLPGTAGSLVLVTSRRRLAALEDATVISLDTLPPEEAGALLARLAARPGLRPGDAAVGEITRLCGYLPLAIGMIASQLRHHPAWPAAGLAADLAAARDRLAVMHAENLSVAAAFDLSYADLTEAQRRLFRRLGPRSRRASLYAVRPSTDRAVGAARAIRQPERRAVSCARAAASTARSASWLARLAAAAISWPPALSTPSPPSPLSLAWRYSASSS
jgi:hypothetical protein